jgi:hypothetical protein
MAQVALLEKENRMAFNEAELNQIYDRTTGRCHICHKKLAFRNYGAVGVRAAWEVEHSIPQAKGGLII